MKILHVVQSLDPAWGGIARVLPELATQLDKAGDFCRIAALSGGRFGAPPPMNGVDVRTFPAKGTDRLGRSSAFRGGVRDLIADCDVVHLHGLWTAQNWAAGKAARAAGKPYIMTPHSMMMPWAWERSRWKKRLAGIAFEHANLRGATFLHALAEGEADSMRRLGFNDRIEIAPNGLHADAYQSLPSPDLIFERFGHLRGKKLIVFLGRISPQKGIVALMQAGFDAFAAAGDWHLVVAGPDEMGLQSTLQAAVERKGASDRVTFTGFLSREETDSLLAAASLLAQPSLSEGLSMSILEALASGLPVLISTYCNMPEVAEKEAGFVVAPNRRAISPALRQAVAMTGEELRAMGQRGRLLIRERFDWSVVTPRYQQMYAKALKR